MTDAAFWDRIAPKYAKDPISNMDAYEQGLARVRSYLKPTDQVLELGCGTGSTALLLADAVTTYQGTDISPGMIAIAQAKLTDEAPANLSFAVSEHVEGTPNTVLAFNLFHLVPELETRLAEIYDTLPEGGLLISKTPAIGEKWYYRPLVAALRLIKKAPFVRFLKVDELDGILVNAGFRIVETGLYPPSTPSRFVVAQKG